MASSTLTSKGQITIPQVVRDAMGLEVGDKIDFVQDQQGKYRMVPRRLDVRVLRGRFAGRVARTVSVKQMADAVEQEAVERLLRIKRPVARGKSGSSK